MHYPKEKNALCNLGVFPDSTPVNITPRLITSESEVRDAGAKKIIKKS